MSETVVDFLLCISNEQKGKLTLLTTGPLPNIALALLGYPGLPSRFERIVVIGGTRQQTETFRR